MIHLTPQGAATAMAAVVVVVVSMAARARHQRKALVLARYRRGEQDREVQQLKADVLESINAGLAQAVRRPVATWEGER